MADIELVIKIDKERFRDIQRIASVQLERNFATAEQIIANGTPLPEGHGDLVDMSQLDSKMYHMAFETDTDLQKWDSGCWIRYKLYEDIRDAMPVIIGAESEGSDNGKNVF